MKIKAKITKGDLNTAQRRLGTHQDLCCNCIVSVALKRLLKADRVSYGGAFDKSANVTKDGVGWVVELSPLARKAAGEFDTMMGSTGRVYNQKLYDKFRASLPIEFEYEVRG